MAKVKTRAVKRKRAPTKTKKLLQHLIDRVDALIRRLSR